MSACTDVLSCCGDDHVVIDYDRLFVSGCLRDEAWIFSEDEADRTLSLALGEAQAMGLEVDPDRSLHRYSGGERALLACLLVMAAAEVNRIRGLRLLLRNVVESLSAERRERLTRALDRRPELETFIFRNGRAERFCGGSVRP
ncbi:MAG: hypothetical protein EOM25_04735 [Deltaproteobacteria bacterium]|nr:hypothetical protein [Deltaproteobacteria bacterium]